MNLLWQSSSVWRSRDQGHQPDILPETSTRSAKICQEIAKLSEYMTLNLILVTHIKINKKSSTFGNESDSPWKWNLGAHEKYFLVNCSIQKIQLGLEQKLCSECDEIMLSLEMDPHAAC